MTSGGITIVDYGCGNPASIRNMLKKLGIKAAITSEAEDILTSGRIIFPGVGAFDHGAARIPAAVTRANCPVSGGSTATFWHSTAHGLARPTGCRTWAGPAWT